MTPRMRSLFKGLTGTSEAGACEAGAEISTESADSGDCGVANATRAQNAEPARYPIARPKWDGENTILSKALAGYLLVTQRL